MNHKLTLLILTGLTLRLIHLGQESFWHDEALTALAAAAPFAQMLEVSRNSNHPPLFYAISWLMSQLWHMNPLLNQGGAGGGIVTEWWLRLPSALLGTANIYLMYRFTRLHRPENIALLAALLMAILPFQIFYSQEARMYQLILTASLIALIGYQANRWPLVILGGTIALYSQSLSGFLLLATLGTAALTFDREKIKPLIVSGVAIALLFSPWILYGLTRQLNQVSAGFWLPQVTLGSFLYAYHTFLWAELSSFVIVIPGMTITFALLIATFYAAWQNQARPLILLAVAPPLIAVIISFIFQPIFIPRALIGATPALYILLADYLPQTRRWVQISLAILLIISLFNFYTVPQKWPHAEWAQDMQAELQPGDAVVYVSALIPLWWYTPNVPSYFIVPDETAYNAGFNLKAACLSALGVTWYDPTKPPKAKRLLILYVISPATTEAQTNNYNALLSTHKLVWTKNFLDDNETLTAKMTMLSTGD